MLLNAQNQIDLLEGQMSEKETKFKERDQMGDNKIRRQHEQIVEVENSRDEWMKRCGELRKKLKRYEKKHNKRGK